MHGHLKPSNILVVENEIKLSADGVLEEDKPARELLGNDLHTAPETTTAPVAASADIWSLGMTLVEVLTQQLPVWDSASETEPVVPASLPKPFAQIARECLHLDPARRCTLSEVRALLQGKPARAPSHLPAQMQVQPQVAEKTSPARIPRVPLIVAFVLLAAIIIGFAGCEAYKTNHSTAANRDDPTGAACGARVADSCATDSDERDGQGRSDRSRYSGCFTQGERHDSGQGGRCRSRHCRS